MRGQKRAQGRGQDRSRLVAPGAAAAFAQESRGGRFVTGFTGEQYAHPEAVSTLRALRRRPDTDRLVTLSAAHPLNLVGIITPGNCLPAVAANRVLLRDGLPAAVREAGKTRFLVDMPPGGQWQAQNALLRRKPPIPLHAFRGQMGESPPVSATGSNPESPVTNCLRRPAFRKAGQNFLKVKLSSRSSH